MVEGETGDFDLENSRRMAGVNVLDRLVREILLEGDEVAESGGLLAFDFDAPDSNPNDLKILLIIYHQVVRANAN